MSITPRRYLFVWMGSAFGYPCRLAVDSVLRADPTAEVVILIHGETPRTEHFEALRRLPTVRITVADPEMLFGELRAGVEPYLRLLRAIPTQAHTARSNVLRYAALHRLGGIYLDFDVLVRQPLHDELLGDVVGLERVWVHDRTRVESGWRISMVAGTLAWGTTYVARRLDSTLTGGWFQTADRWRIAERRWNVVQPNNAVIGSPAGSGFTAALLDRVLDVDPTVRFSTGPSLLADTLADDPGLARLLPPEVLYPVPPSESFRFFQDRHLVLDDRTLLIHYVGSNHKDLLAGIRQGDPRFARPEVFWTLARHAAAHRTRERQLL